MEFETRTVPGWKRSLDLLLLLLSLPFTLPVMLVVGVYVRMVSPGPVFFKQERVGLGGRPFTVWKFRTMHPNASTTVHQQHVTAMIARGLPMIKLDAKGDKRLIRGGSIVRALALDELPQLINVFLGEMSLVGPRPCLWFEYEQLQPWQLHRFDTLPGMTGWWQIRRRKGTTFTEMLELDRHYCEHLSLVLDLRILVTTPFEVFKQFLDTSRKPSARVTTQPEPEVGVVRSAG